MKNKGMQLFVLPYAGGSNANFKRLKEGIDPRIEVIVIEYPGRGKRRGEDFSETLTGLIRDAADSMNRKRDVELPYSVLGYSMGSVLAYEILVSGEINGACSHVFLSAEISPRDRAAQLSQVQNPTDQFILKRAKGLGGLDPRLAENERFAQIFIRPLVSDYKLFYTYRFADGRDKLKCNATFFYSQKDTPLAEVKKWDELIEGDLDYYEFGENHFFINQYYAQMSEIINGHLKLYL